ncbi:hypothetical protein RchiOBHm_Chr6g0290211 [Rosa chinensis]|uniref:Uncharacterized protein n=1 Tax=Rosa chinensis TaxID=74649 RepID=A0A2P6PVS3_ROSCH|nr:hypothetical protein RchiOBHm_Chr6g0290211 [Rosa chinensis]
MWDVYILNTFLFEALHCLVVYALIQAFFPLGKIYVMIFGASVWVLIRRRNCKSHNLYHP